MASKIDALPLRMKTVVLNLGTKIDDLPSLAPLLVVLLFITLATSLVFLSIVVVTFVNTARRRKIELPGPEGWPLIGVSLNLPTRPRKILNTYRKKYGDAFKIRMGWYDWVFFNTPEGVKEVFDKQSAVTSHKVALPMAHDYVMRDQGILSMGYTMKWRKMRTYMHQLLSPKASLAFVPSQEFEIKQLLYDFSRDEGKVSTDFYMYIRRMTFSIMMTSTYGQRIPEWDCQEVRDVYGNMRILSIILSPGTFWMDIFPPLSIIPKFLMPSFYKARWCRNFMQENTMRHWNNLKEKYEKGVAPECFAKHIMDSDYQSQGLSEETVSWLAHAIPEAGAETTASALNSLIMHLAAFPGAQERAAEECTRVLGDGRLATLDDEPEMPYIRAVIKEILRMCPVATTGLRRQAGGDVHYNGTIIPKGTILLANINALHWDEDRFSNPFSFQPERYLSHTQRSAFYANSGDVSQRDHFTFGAGRRICPGVHLAENGLFLAVANLIWAYEFRAPLGDNGQEIKIDIGDEAFSDGAIRIPKPYKIRIIPRNEKRLALVKGIWEKAKAEGYVMRGLNVSESIGIDVK